MLIRQCDTEIQRAYKAARSRKIGANRLYTIPLAVGRDLVIFIVIHQVQETFSVQSGWCDAGDVSSWIAAPFSYPISWPESQIVSGNISNRTFRFPLSFLWMPNEYWWSAEDTAARRRLDAAFVGGDPRELLASIKAHDESDASDAIDASVRDVFYHIHSHLLPFIERTVKNASDANARED